MGIRAAIKRFFANPLAWNTVDIGGAQKALDEMLAVDLSTREPSVAVRFEHYLDFFSPEHKRTNTQIVRTFLDKLGDEIDKLDGHVGFYPGNPIGADVWLNSVAIARIAEVGAERLREAGWIVEEEAATAAWAKATLQVQSHYHHIVGPAMIAWGECNERLGDTARATQIYGAVIADFSWIADEWEGKCEAPPRDQRTALHCLEIAVRQTATLNPGRENASSLSALLDRLKQIAARPVEA